MLLSDVLEINSVKEPVVCSARYPGLRWLQQTFEELGLRQYQLVIHAQNRPHPLVLNCSDEKCFNVTHLFIMISCIFIHLAS